MADAVFDDFSERKSHRNLGLEVEDQRFWVSRDAMIEVSSVFMNMLNGEFQEKYKDVIPLPEKSAGEILELLRCLFTGKEVTDQNVDVLLKFGDEYDIQCLMKQCKKALIDQTRKMMATKVGQGEKKIIKLFLTAVRYKMTGTVRRTLPVVARFGLAKMQPFFGELAIEVRCAVLTQMAGQWVEHVFVMQGRKMCFGCHKNSKLIHFCSFCSFVLCSMCHKNKVRQDYAAQCVVCHTCRKPTVFKLLKDEIQLSSGCQCINPLANEELKKIGLYERRR